MTYLLRTRCQPHSPTCDPTPDERNAPQVKKQVGLKCSDQAALIGRIFDGQSEMVMRLPEQIVQKERKVMSPPIHPHPPSPVAFWMVCPLLFSPWCGCPLTAVLQAKALEAALGKSREETRTLLEMMKPLHESKRKLQIEVSRTARKQNTRRTIEVL